MLNNNTWCVIMAGGTGTRFWPVSTSDTPKQFLPLGETGRSFIQMTAERFKDLIPLERTLVVTTRKFAPLVRKHLPDLPEENILQEPLNKDTAPCIALAAYTVLKRDPAGVMVVVPCDHVINDVKKFQEVISHSVYKLGIYPEAIGTIGLKATRPDTNFGYIQTEGIAEMDVPIKVKTFTEKPDKELAEVFVQSGEFLWNSGIYLWHAETIIADIEKYQPHLAKMFKGWEKTLDTLYATEFLDNVYSDLTKLSIDYAIMEQTDRSWVYPAEMGWYDVGTWCSMYDFLKNNYAENNTSNVPIITQESNGNLMISTTKKKLIAVSGLENFVVVDTGKALMICPRDDKKLRDLTANIALPEYEKYR